MVIGTAADAQAEALGQGQASAHILLRVLTVVGFNGVQAAVFEAAQHFFQPAFRSLPEQGVGQAHGGAQTGQQGHAVFGLQYGLGQIGLALASQINAKGLAGVPHIVLAHQHGRNVRAAHAFPLGLGPHLVHTHLQPQGLEFGHNAHVALVPFSAQPDQFFLQGGNVLRQPEAQNVQLAQLRAGGYFAAAHQHDARFSACGGGLVQAGQGIVVGYGHSGQLGFGRIAHELGGGVGAV